MFLYAAFDALHHAGAPMRRSMRQTAPMITELPIFGARELGAAFDLIGNNRLTFTRPEFGITETTVAGKTVGVTEEVLLKHPFCKLVRFRKDTPKKGKPVLIVAPYSGHFATLVRDTVEAMLSEHDVLVTDWQNARDVPVIFGPFGLDDFISLIMRFIRYISEEFGRPHVMAVCQPGPPVLSAASLMAGDNDAARPASMILIASPVDTRVSATKVNEHAERHSLSWFRSHATSYVSPPNFGACRWVYPSFLQLAGFMNLDANRHHTSFWEQYKRVVEGDHLGAAEFRDFYAEYLAIMDLAGEMYIETIYNYFQQHTLARGEARWEENIIDPGAITDIPLMTIEGGRDNITGRGQCEAAHMLTPKLPANMHEKLFAKKAGHYGVFAGSRFKREIQPKIAKFIRAAA